MVLVTGEVVFCYVMCYDIIIWLKKETVEDFDAAKFVYIYMEMSAFLTSCKKVRW